jgi:quercetin dioxygenase-like cupin family protein
MTIDFNSMNYETFPNFKGGEGSLVAKMFFDGTCRAIRGFLEPGSSIGYHQHVNNCELIYILSGEGTVNEDGVETKVSAGEVSYCGKGHWHSLTNTGKENLQIYCVVPEVR